MQDLLCLSIALIAGLLMSRLAKVLKLPAVTAYLVAGIIVGPYCLGRLGVPGLGFISHDTVTSYKVISDVALGFIAFAIGSEFKLQKLKETGKQATVVAFTQALAATLLVDIALIALHFILGGDKLSISAAIMLGAIATATAPAATLMVVKQYKAKGPLTSILLPIVALDDAIGLVVFAISYGIARAMNSGQVDVISVIIEPLIEVAASLLLGSVMGIILTFIERFFESNSKRLSMSITFVLLTVALSMMEFEIGGVKIGFSSLLVCMMLGTLFCNISKFSDDVMERADRWTAPLYILFFVLSGAELELSVFSDIAIIGIGALYIIVRSLGKYAGAFGGAKLMKCSDTIVKHLGITLLPQAGVALGMSLVATESMGADGALIRNITLFAVLIYELVGPLLTKRSLIEAGEISIKPEIHNRKANSEYERK